MREIFCILIVSMSIFQLYCAIVLQDVTTGGNWVKHTCDLFVLFLTSACESITIYLKI